LLLLVCSSAVAPFSKGFGAGACGTHGSTIVWGGTPSPPPKKVQSLPTYIITYVVWCWRKKNNTDVLSHHHDAIFWNHTQQRKK
jgi:hypothetical protein